MAVANDYSLLLHNLKTLRDMTVALHKEVEGRRSQGPRERLEPNRTSWVFLMDAQLEFITPLAQSLQRGTKDVLSSKPGEAVFNEQPPTRDSV